MSRTKCNTNTEFSLMVSIKSTIFTPFNVTFSNIKAIVLMKQGLFEFVRFRYRDKKRLRTNSRTTMVSDVNEKDAHGSSRRQLHHYQNLLTLASVRLEHSGLYSCVPSSGLPNATVNLHVVKGTFCICGFAVKKENNKWYLESHIRLIREENKNFHLLSSQQIGSDQLLLLEHSLYSTKQKECLKQGIQIK